jgi:hypothetical protein
LGWRKSLYTTRKLFTVVAQTTAVVSFFSRVAIAFLLHLGFVFASDNGSAAIGIVVLVTESLGFVIQL